jgi:hypothetical protein
LVILLPALTVAVFSLLVVRHMSLLARVCCKSHSDCSTHLNVARNVNITDAWQTNVTTTWRPALPQR